MGGAVCNFLSEAAVNPLVILVAACVVADTIFGMMKALKQHTFNASFGLDGAIRKVVMIVSVLFLMLVDRLIGINVIGLISPEVREAVRIDRIGLGELFCIMYALHEMASILRNWYVFGLPVPKWMESKVEGMLAEMSNSNGQAQAEAVNGQNQEGSEEGADQPGEG